MPRHVSSPRMLSWWQRTAIAAPIALLASVAVVAVTSGDDNDPVASNSTDAPGSTVASTTPTAVRNDPTMGSSDTRAKTDEPRSEAPESNDSDNGSDDGDQDRNQDDDGSESTPDVIAPDRNNDDQTTPPDESSPETDEPETVDPDSDNDNGGADRGDKDNGQGNTNDPDNEDQPEDDTTDSDDEDSDGKGTVGDGKARAECLAALKQGGLHGKALVKAVNVCVSELVGTPLSGVTRTLDGTVADLLRTLDNDSNDSDGLLCGVLGICRD